VGRCVPESPSLNRFFDVERTRESPGRFSAIAEAFDLGFFTEPGI
jgi:hypothetical protein